MVDVEAMPRRRSPTDIAETAVRLEVSHDNVRVESERARARPEAPPNSPRRVGGPDPRQRGPGYPEPVVVLPAEAASDRLPIAWLVGGADGDDPRETVAGPTPGVRRLARPAAEPPPLTTLAVLCRRGRPATSAARAGGCGGSCLLCLGPTETTPSGPPIPEAAPALAGDQLSCAHGRNLAERTDTADADRPIV